MEKNNERKAMILDVARKTLHTEAEALHQLEATLDSQFTEAVEVILASGGKVIMTGVGKSGLIARKIAATLASTGTPSFFLHPTEAFHGDLGMISKGDVIVALSYSGETDEVLKIIPFIHTNGNKFISITGNAESTLAKHSDIHLFVGVGEEACILRLAPTTSTTTQLAMGDALAVALMKMRDFTSVDFARLHPGGSLGRRLLMNVGNVMRSEDLPIVAPDCIAKDMIHAISRGGLGLIVVCDEKSKIVGIITDGDIRRAMERSEANFFTIKASDILTPDPKRIRPAERLIEAEKMMTKYKVNSLLVANEADNLVGIIQIYDIKL
ncbi:MAG: KpsF/GutQ family sugar-phosphate isomerase [Rikenellaceae bacterium]